MQLAEYGKKIIERRNEFIEQVNGIISEIHYKLTGGKERIVLSYESSVGNQKFEDVLRKNREKDIKFKSTSAGPHRDDLCFYTGKSGYSKIWLSGTAKDGGFIVEAIGNRACKNVDRKYADLTFR